MVKVGEKYRMLNHGGGIMTVIAVKGDRYDCSLEHNREANGIVRDVLYAKGGWVDTECELIAHKESNIKKLLQRIDEV